MGCAQAFGLEIRDESRPRLDCVDALVPAQQSLEQGEATARVLMKAELC
jgi:hypothetical protein